MRVAAALLVLGVLVLVVSSGYWLRGDTATPLPPDAKGIAQLLDDLDHDASGAVTIEIATLYAGRRELLDPRLALPTWHTLAHDPAVAVSKATRSCPPGEVAGALDAALAKALRFHAVTCEGVADAARDDLVEHAPFLHPSGRSYAALALKRSATRAWVTSHLRAFHVLELAALDPAALDAQGRALAEISASDWESLARGDRLLLTARSLVVAEHGPFGVERLRIHPRSAWDQLARSRALVLVQRPRGGACSRPAASELCWETLTGRGGLRPWLGAITVTSAALVVATTFALGAGQLRERRRHHADRIHVLRTLTHELRTPATSLSLDIEPLRAAYDDLPVDCQEPLLRMADGIGRLQRVLHRSARYMALFETSGAARTALANVRDVSSARELFEELAGEWPEGVTLVAAEEDVALHTDPEWLGVAVRNLVENAQRHGRPPVEVRWQVEEGTLVVRVSDAGTTPALALSRAALPFARAQESEGLGLGLAIVTRIAQLLGGRLRHEPSPTAFELRVPADARGPA